MYVVRLNDATNRDWYPAWLCLEDHNVGYYRTIYLEQDDVPKFDSADEAANWYNSNKQQIMYDLDAEYSMPLDFDNPEFVDIGDKFKPTNIRNMIDSSKYVITSCGMLLVKGKTYSLDECVGEYYYLDESMDVNLLCYVELFDSPEQAKQYCIENANAIFDDINGIDMRCRSQLSVTKINFRIDVDGSPTPIVLEEEDKNVCHQVEE